MDQGTKNFQELIDNYEDTIKEITNELDSFQEEQRMIKCKMGFLINENKDLSTDLSNLLRESSNVDIPEIKFKDTDYIENLKAQLKAISEERENAVKLWQNAMETIDNLEGELQIFRDNTQGLVPKSELTRIKLPYEEKIKHLETLLEKSENRASEQLKLKCNEPKCECQHNQHNSLKIIENLTKEIAILQKKIKENEKSRHILEQNYKRKIEENEIFRLKNEECRMRVEEALQIIEAALNEKDEALKRESRAQEELEKVTKSLSEAIGATETAKSELLKTKANYEARMEESNLELKKIKEKLNSKFSELEQITKDNLVMNKELEILRKSHSEDGGEVCKLLSLEKNLEHTFQKLLLAEKQNIKLSSEKESIKNDLDEMSRYYERDIRNREAEKIALKADIKKLQIEVKDNKLKFEQETEKVTDLLRKNAFAEARHQEIIEDTKSTLQRSFSQQIEEIEKVHNSLVNELRGQLVSQIEINKKWRIETKNIAEKLEQRIAELKNDLRKSKTENRLLVEKLKEANKKIIDYKKFLQLISQDVGRIASVTVPEQTDRN